ncbi:HEAT repeat protein [Catenulispora sp. GAS73]|uniref:HEAT repeat domain-containing protein n=1 Tax=Catenulispora sp. GAS73 TaxID=3156269 RepID=UPI0035130A7D
MDHEQIITRAAALGPGTGTGEHESENDAEERWRLIGELHRSTGRDAFEAVLAAAVSDEPARRLVALDALGQIGYATGRPYAEETLPVLISAAGDDDAGVVASAVTALGHVGDARALPAVLRQVGHASAEVRFAAAVALPSLTGADEPGAVVAEGTGAAVAEALIALTRDPDPEVRDWATFGLGTQLDADGPEIREALAARLDDDYDQAAEEAVAGLARRGDPRAAAALLDQLRQLADDDSILPGTLLFELAAASPTTDALPLLRRLWQRRNDFEPAARQRLAEAIEAHAAGSPDLDRKS